MSCPTSAHCCVCPQALALKNAAKVHTKWRELLRQAKKTELQKQVQHIAEAHEHAMQSRGKLMEACPSSIRVFGSPLYYEGHAPSSAISECCH